MSRFMSTRIPSPAAGFRLLEALERRMLFAAPGLLVEFNGVDLTPNDNTPSVVDGTDFGGVAQGATPVRHVFTITNTGDADLDLFSGGTAALDTFRVDDSAFSTGDPIPPGGQVSLVVELVSEKPGLKEDDISLRTNVPSLPALVRFAIRGFVEAGSVELGTVGPAPVRDAATVSIGSSQDGAGSHPTRHEPRTVRFGLAGPTASNLTVGARVIDDGEFDSDVRLVVTRDADGDGVLDLAEYNAPLIDQLIPRDGGRVQFPKGGLAAGQYLAHTAVEDEFVDVGGAEVQYELDLSAEAAPAPDVRVRFGTTEITDGDATPSASEGTDFGAVAAGGEGPQRTFTVTNAGGSTLNLPGAVSVPPGFELVSGLPPTLAPGASASFVIKLESASAGAKGGQVSFATNAPGEDPFNFSVGGTVTQDQPPPPPPPPAAGPVSVAAVEATLPPVVVGGAKKARGKVTVTLLNTSPDKISGRFTIRVYAAAGGSELPLRTVTKKLKLKGSGGAKLLKIKVKVPAPPASGDYQILAELSGNGSSSARAAAGVVRIETPA